VQQAWPQVLDAVKNRKKVAWMTLQHARVLSVDGYVITIGFERPGDVKGFLNGRREEDVATVLGELFGGTWRVEVVLSGGGPGPSGPSGGTRPTPPGPGGSGAPAGSGASAGSGVAGGGSSGAGSGSPGSGGSGGAGAYERAGASVDARAMTATQAGTAPTGTNTPTVPTAQATPTMPTAPAVPAQAGATDESWPDAPSDEDDGRPDSPMPERPLTPAANSATGATQRAKSAAVAAARSAAQSVAKSVAQSTAQPVAQAGWQGARADRAWPEEVPGRRGTGASRAPGADADDVDPDDAADAGVDELTGMALIQQELGGQIIQEIDHL
jgi:DNA polymerase-3 subunit gamma/tau